MIVVTTIILKITGFFYCCFVQFKIRVGRTLGFDEPRPGAPKTATTEDNVKKIDDLVLADRRLKAREIAETVGI